MITVYLRPLQHREQQAIAIFFDYNKALQQIIKKLRGATFSNTHRCWYIPISTTTEKEITAAFEGKAIVDTSALKIASPLTPNKGSEKKLSPRSPGLYKSQAVHPVKPQLKIHAVNNHVIPAMQQMLKLKAYSPSTLRTYLNEMTQLLLTLKSTRADSITPEQLKRYMVYCLDTMKLKENTLHSRINAMKFYYEQVLGREKFFWEIPRPKKQLILPKVLGEDELARLFNALDNIKHKAMLFTAYSAGLRVSEVTALKIKHIDSGRMQIYIENAKGKKDRYVSLSPVLLDILRQYIKGYRRRPVEYLFESEQTGTCYPTRTVQRVFQLAKEKAGISKDVGVHSLRHSFATHMLEKGIDIKYIKELLGHFNIKTTERYLHVSRKQLVNLVSPLDDLWRTGKIEW